MDKCLFAPRLPPRGAQTAKGDINRVLDLRQRIRQLGIVRIKDAGDVHQRSTRRGGDVVHAAILNQQPQQMIAH